MDNASKKTNDTLAPKLIKKSFTLLGEALTAVGRPLYLGLTYLVIVILFIAYVTGYISRTIPTSFSKLSNKLSRIIKKAFLATKSRQIYPEPKLRVISKKIKEAFPIILKLLGKYFLKITAWIFSLINKVSLTLLANYQKYSKKINKLKRVRLAKLASNLKSLQSRLISLTKPIRIKRRVIVILLTNTIFLIIGISYIFWSIILKDLPTPQDLVERKIEVSTKIYDRNNQLLYNIYENQNRTIVPLNRIPAHVRLATIAIEDAEFYNHPGFSVRGIIRAAIRNIKRGELTGGSTITQQLVKNALLTPEKTVIRKIREIVLSIKVELAFSKNEILEMYLNEVAYGGTSYGIQEASQVYFNKDVDQLTLGEAALLAGLPKSPTRFSPFGSNPNLAFTRQWEVLNLMEINDFITEEQKLSAEKESIDFAANKNDIKAPHFVMFIRQTLVDKYGEEVVAKGGLEVSTSLDLRIQNLAERVVREEVDKLTKLNVSNGAALVIDVKNNEILAMVGSKDYFDIENDGNVNLTTSLRQPGSSIKVVNYSYALSNGYTASSILSDNPITYNVPGQPPYSPRNYDNRFRGNLPLRNALAESRNIPAVKVLASYGVDKMIEQGRKLGITTWSDPSNYGLSLTLGGGEIKLVDLANVYTTIANYGTYRNVNSLLKVTNYEGKVLEERSCDEPGEQSLIAQSVDSQIGVYATDSAAKTFSEQKSNCQGKQVLDPRVAYLLIDILKDNQARSPAFGSNSLLVIPNHGEVAVKTGTSNDLRDNLAIGFNQKYLVAVWVGNNNNSPMSRIASGVTGATPIFHNIMKALLGSDENHQWTVPQNLVQVPTCPITGTLACQGCPIRVEWFLEESKPTKTCNFDYEKEKEDKKGKKAKPTIYLPSDRQGEILEPAIWIERENIY